MMKWLREYWKSRARRDAPVPAPDQGPFILPQEVRLSVGLDVGTAATKVVFFQFGAGARVFRPLRFDHRLEHWPDYILPSVGLIRDQTLVWGAEAARELGNRSWREGIRRLKVLFAGTRDSAFADPDLEADYLQYLQQSGVDQRLWCPEHVMTASLALQIVTVRKQLQALYPGKRIDAQFTIPVPIDQAQDSHVLAVYRRAANGAGQLTTRDGTLRVRPNALLDAAAEAYSAASDHERPDGRMFTLPEAVAEVASYVTSLEARTGVHGVIDVGAGTTDVCIFSQERTARRVNVCFWYSALTIPMGTAFVHKSVAATLNESTRGGAVTDSKIEQECERNTGVVETALEQIRHCANPAWARGYGHLKKESAWRGCPVFLCGGGALLPRAQQVFRQCWVPSWPPHEIKKLPAPGNYQGKGVPFQRMTVAYGLAIPGPEHGDYVLPNDSPDHTPPKRYKPPGGMGGDQLYPTPDW